MTVTWDAREDLTVKYIHGYSDFAYTFDYDYDDSDSQILDCVDVLRTSTVIPMNSSFSGR